MENRGNPVRLLPLSRKCILVSEEVLPKRSRVYEIRAQICDRALSRGSLQPAGTGRPAGPRSWTGGPELRPFHGNDGFREYRRHPALPAGTSRFDPLGFEVGRGTIDVHVGPSGYVASQGFVFAKGDALQVLGSRVTIGTGSAIIAKRDHERREEADSPGRHRPASVGSRGAARDRIAPSSESLPPAVRAGSRRCVALTPALCPR